MRLSAWPLQFCSQTLPLSPGRPPLLDSVEAQPGGASLTIEMAGSSSASQVNGISFRFASHISGLWNFSSSLLLDLVRKEKPVQLWREHKSPRAPHRTRQQGCVAGASWWPLPGCATPAIPGKESVTRKGQERAHMEP